VVSLLEYDSHLAAIEHSADRGVQIAHTILNVARSIGDEPTFAAQSFMKFFRQRATPAAMGSMATGNPKTGLEELHAAFIAEADEPPFLFAARGERAICHELFEGLEFGLLKIGVIASMCGDVDSPLADPMIFRSYRPLLRGDHAKCLRLYKTYIGGARLP
jgi:hypothetical protein